MPVTTDHVDGLRRELAYYDAQGKPDRAELVRTELGKAEKALAAALRAEAKAAEPEADRDVDKSPRSLRATAKEVAVVPPAEKVVDKT